MPYEVSLDGADGNGNELFSAPPRRNAASWAPTLSMTQLWFKRRVRTKLALVFYNAFGRSVLHFTL